MKIVVLDGYTENPGDLSWKGLEELGSLTVYDRTEEKDIVSRIEGAEAVFTNKTPVTEETMAKSPSLSYIGVLATGYNVVDVKAAAKRNITVCNVPSYGTDTVAQYTMALLLELCHHVGEHAKSVKERQWCASSDFCYWMYPMTELSGKTMGIIGYGKIGQRTAQLAKAFGMKVLVTAAHPIAAERLDEKIRQADLEELLSKSDVISLHCPLTKDNTGMINKKTISLMKDGVFLINTARGPLIEEEDLAEALRSGKAAGAAVDVVSKEPIAWNNPLLSAPNIIITPHIAWAAKEARMRLMETAVENLRAFLEGKPQNTVN